MDGFSDEQFEHLFLKLFVSNHGEGTNNWAVDQIRRRLHLNDKSPSHITPWANLRSHLKLTEE
jgi:hypothetical protein